MIIIYIFAIIGLIRFLISLKKMIQEFYYLFKDSKFVKPKSTKYFKEIKFE